MKRSTWTACGLAALALCSGPSALAADPAPAAAPAAAPAPAPNDDTAKLLYQLGLVVGRSLSNYYLTPAELEIVFKGAGDAAQGKAQFDRATFGPKIQEFVKQRSMSAGQAFVDQAAQQPGAVRTPSGALYFELTPGTGAQPTERDTVRVNYRGTLINGREFDSSYKHGQPATFPLNGVIRCWTEGLQKMKVGGKARLVCPQFLAYGAEEKEGIPPYSALVFEVELLDVSK